MIRLDRSETVSTNGDFACRCAKLKMVNIHAAVGEGGDGLTDLVNEIKVQFSGDELLFVGRTFGDDIAPRINKHALPAHDGASGIANGVNGGDEELIFDRACAQQGAPVVYSDQRPFGDDEDQAGVSQGVVPEKFREAQIVTDGEASIPGGELCGNGAVTGIQPAIFVHQAKEVDFVVAGMVIALRVNEGEGVEDIPFLVIEKRAADPHVVFAGEGGDNSVEVLIGYDMCGGAGQIVTRGPEFRQEAHVRILSSGGRDHLPGFLEIAREISGDYLHLSQGESHFHRWLNYNGITL